MSQGSEAGKLRQSETPFWRSLVERFAFGEHDVTRASVSQVPVDPLRCETPVLRHAEIAAVYSGNRVAGDFYEFLRVGPNRMLFLLLDIAGTRADTREILIEVQKTFRTLAPQLFKVEDLNETTAMVELCQEMNRTIMRGGLRSCPAFIGCYNEDLGTVCYANAGHPPGMLRDEGGITMLEATGLPLGLFSHTPQSAAACHLLPGCALIVVSRGVLEADHDDEEFGLDGVRATFELSACHGAHELCLDLVQAAQKFAPETPSHNDLTTLALVRNAPLASPAK